MTELMEVSETASTINPVDAVLDATAEAFEIMLSCSVTKLELQAQTWDTSFNDITAVIALTGTINGTICLSFPKQTAFEAVNRMVGILPDEIDALVCDAVGEFANVVGGSAKDKTNDPTMKLGLPNVIHGEDHHIEIPSSASPVCVEYDSDIGPFMVLFGFSGA
ncbi:MAG: chemotaxis protein CheX [Planctomycetaceae bacterium]|nr:chemotaxis protein CheX [Planctomycetaceae bacterium]